MTTIAYSNKINHRYKMLEVKRKMQEKTNQTLRSLYWEEKGVIYTLFVEDWIFTFNWYKILEEHLIINKLLSYFYILKIVMDPYVSRIVLKV